MSPDFSLDKYTTSYDFCQMNELCYNNFKVVNKLYKSIKKIELHLHLDGCVRVATAEKLLNKSHLKDQMIVQESNQNLSEYLTKFNIPNSIMQTKENLELISRELIEDLKRDGVIYAEVRFSPLLHTKKGLSFDEIIESVLKGLQDNEIKTNLILCMMRNASIDENMKVIHSAYKYLGKGVVGIDLAGDESKYPTDLFQELFDQINKLNIPLTVHAGEAASSNNIKEAVINNAKRIGHGIKLIEDMNLLEYVKNNNITLEICPTSNIQTKVVPSFEEHPIKKLVDAGVAVTINTDNRTVSNTTLSHEYELLNQYFNYSIPDFKAFNMNAIHASFLSDEEKKELKNKIGI